MVLYDISITITPEMPVWPGDPRVRLERISQIAAGDMANVSRLECGVHTGTHLDAPIHFVEGGAAVEQLPLDVLIGPVEVVQAPDEIDLIDATFLDTVGLPARIERVLFKTRNSRIWTSGVEGFQKDFVALAPDGARFLVEHGIRLVGIDYLSIAPFDDPVPTHQILLERGVIALEGVNLSAVEPGRYILYCLPLKLGGSDGAPARTVLIS
ncbi:MAG TPA: cyclase family protein [Anaerolineaceae bacterium]|nr:cyclase family protein [Anaerolineaceae bacterium]